MTNNEKELLEGFNAGYLIEKHRPELSQKLVNGLDGVEVPFIEGFIAGSKEFVRERNVIKSISVSRKQEYNKGGIPRPTKGLNKDDRDKGFDIGK